MKAFLAGAALGLVCAGGVTAPVSAAAVFTSVASLTATLSLGNGAALTGLGFGGTSSFYSATAIAGTGDRHRISSGIQGIDRETSPPATFDHLLAQGSLAAAMLSHETYGMDYPVALASSDTAMAHARGQPSGSGLTISFESNIFGLAFPEDGAAAADISWTGVTRFTNLTTEELLITWTVSYFLSASAHVDDPASAWAVTETRLLAGVRSAMPPHPARSPAFAVIAAADPDIDPPVSSLPIRPNPDPVSGTIAYELRLAPGASDSFELVIDQFGFAAVPLPAPILLVLTAFGALLMMARNRPVRDFPPD